MTIVAHEQRDVILKVTGVSVTRGETRILRDLNLEIKDLYRPGFTQGQVIGLLGPTGVGKTTLFRILAGLEAPDCGTVLLEKEGIPVRRGMVGVVPQHYPLFAHRTVLGNLLVAGGHLGLTRPQFLEKARGLLQRFGMEGHEKKYPPQLSGGQQQRVAIAQQFMCSEHFLLMDEPFSGLDLIAQDNIIKFVREMAQTDELKTFIIVTHDISAALQVADTIWILGRDRDAQGQVVPGARLQKSIDLCDRGIAWRDDILSTPEFSELRQEIRDIFPRL
ncbi:MAG: ATP-binding cassette domain-containing protein [Armatimonadota bacterium]|nr:ATP-binding cassette domain-containing protein [Armatimonadota bacterium]